MLSRVFSAENADVQRRREALLRSNSQKKQQRSHNAYGGNYCTSAHMHSTAIKRKKQINKEKAPSNNIVTVQLMSATQPFRADGILKNNALWKQLHDGAKNRMQKLLVNNATRRLQHMTENAGHIEALFTQTQLTLAFVYSLTSPGHSSSSIAKKIIKWNRVTLNYITTLYAMSLHCWKTLPSMEFDRLTLKSLCRKHQGHGTQTIYGSCPSMNSSQFKTANQRAHYKEHNIISSIPA